MRHAGAINENKKYKEGIVPLGSSYDREILRCARNRFHAEALVLDAHSEVVVEDGTLRQLHLSKSRSIWELSPAHPNSGLWKLEHGQRKISCEWKKSSSLVIIVADISQYREFASMMTS